jgi:SAM-dependent methyltransferase
VRALFVLSVLASACLMFLLQPLLARMLLPAFGGSPAVWNTCMVFFQVLLLSGYAYAHESVRRFGIARQMVLHAAIVLGSIAMLPHALSSMPEDTAHPELAVLRLLVGMAAVPFFVLSTNSSLTQRWFSVASLRGSSDPFWLYAASNVGSLVALLSYPLLVEPSLGVRAQLHYWAIGYVAFALITVATMYVTYRRTRSAASLPVDGPAVMHTLPEKAVTTRRRMSWVARSAIASSLLLSITMEISTDVIAAPLFWVLPLALYLLSFVVAFSSHRPRRSAVSYATLLGIALCLVLVIVPTVLPLWFALVTLLATLFAGALLCHGDLADDRPSARDLTSFYLWISIGGAIGGIANSLVAPLIFSSIAEYPVTLLLLACVVRTPGAGRDAWSWRGAREMLVSPVALTMIAATLVATVAVLHGRADHVRAASDTTILQWQFMPLAILVCGVLYRRQPGIFQLSTALTAAFVLAGLQFTDPIIDQARSFFGVSRVTENGYERILIHGVTVHGSQRKAPALRDIPTSYYYPDGPLGWVVAHAPDNAAIGVVGLGAGSLAPLARAGQSITFFEIDPLVETMARRDFTFLADTKASVRVAIGDGRRLIAAEPDDRFDVLVLDAFSGDAIPTHLLTEEAISLYLRKLKSDGVLVIHISNRYADLARVLRGWHDATGQRVAMSQYVPAAREQAQGVRSTVAVALSRSPRGLMRLAQTRQWYWIEDDGPSVRWTDDHVSVIDVLNRNILRP